MLSKCSVENVGKAQKKSFAEEACLSFPFSNVGGKFSSSKLRDAIRIAGSIEFLEEARRIVFSLVQNKIPYKLGDLRYMAKGLRFNIKR